MVFDKGNLRRVGPEGGDMGYGLWVMGYGLWVTGYGLWVTGYGLRVKGERTPLAIGN